jgi:hypothetical protein
MHCSNEALACSTEQERGTNKDGVEVNVFVEMVTRPQLAPEFLGHLGLPAGEEIHADETQLRPQDLHKNS